MKILVVDDHPLIREALRQVLQSLDRDLELIEAQSCDEALEMTQRHTDISLILLDLTLPGADGYEVLRRLREDYPDIPVVVLSAADQPEAVTRAIDGGAMGFIPKTSSSQLLLNALRLVLSGAIYLPLEVLRKEQDIGPATPRAPATPSELRDPAEIGLTARQAQVLALLVQGKPNKLICRALNLAEGTVKIHVTAILKTLSVMNRTQAVIAVSKLGLKLPQP